ncbi:MAG TPA: PIN domain-containing protein [Polyangiaceae bacterium]|nr:PIN domain-containing protein [Polyangiaceae bacterium]
MGKARTGTTAPEVTLDAGALIAIDRGDRRMIALLDQIATQGGRLHVPAGALGQAWRDGRTQAILARFVRAAEVDVVPLDATLSRACGELLASSGTSDVIDASVVIVARQTRGAIFTTDLDDLARLDPKAALVKV